MCICVCILYLYNFFYDYFYIYNICFHLSVFIAVQAASKTLMDSLNEIYESQWTGHDLLYVQAQNLDMLWQDFTHKLADQVLVPLNTYQCQFPEMRVSILH